MSRCRHRIRVLNCETARRIISIRPLSGRCRTKDEHGDLGPYAGIFASIMNEESGPRRGCATRRIRTPGVYRAASPSVLTRRSRQLALLHAYRNCLLFVLRFRRLRLADRQNAIFKSGFDLLRVGAAGDLQRAAECTVATLGDVAVPGLLFLLPAFRP